MKRAFLLIFLLAAPTLHAAQVAVSGLLSTTSPSTNSWINVADLNASPKSRKYLLTNLVTQATADATYAPLADPTFTGTVTVNTTNITEALNYKASISYDGSSIAHLTIPFLMVTNTDPGRVVVTDGATKDIKTATATTTEVDYLSGVTSAIQTQLNGKQPTITSSTDLTARSLTIANNITYQNGTGDPSYVNMNEGLITKTVSGAVTLDYVTNGVASSLLSSVVVYYNGSGSDQTLTLPIMSSGANGWRTNAFNPVPTKLTNDVITIIRLTTIGATDSLAKQTNAMVTFSYF